MDVLAQAAAVADRPGVLPREAVIVVAVSGGADSVVLLEVLSKLAPDRGWRLVVATFDHGWRDVTGEIALVARLADERGWPHVVGRAATARSENAARDARHAFLCRVAAEHGAERIALGHNADDRAETLLMNLMRGAGTRGLAAMPALNPPLVRPLAEVPAAEVRAYAAALGLPFEVDPSNADPRYLRNRVRHELIPLLEEIRPGATAALRRSAEVCARDAAVSLAAADDVLENCRRLPRYLQGAGAVCLDWRHLPAGDWLGPVLVAAIGKLRGGLAGLRHSAVEHLIRFCESRHDAKPATIMAGVVASHFADWMILTRTADRYQPWEPVPLRPGRNLIEAAEIAVWLDEIPPIDVVITKFATDDQPLVVRSRRPGDRLRPVSASREVKVSDLLQECGVPWIVRDRVPILAAGGRVIWPGCGEVAEEYAPRPDNCHTIAVELLGDPEP